MGGIRQAPICRSKQVLGYLARYTHRVAIANSRLVKLENGKVTLRWKDYRRKGDNQHGCMTIPASEFIRRFLLHVLPDGFHRIRYHGLFANGHRAKMIARCRLLLQQTSPAKNTETINTASAPPSDDYKSCPCCGGVMIIIEVVEHPYSRSNRHHKSTRLDAL